MTGLTIVNGQLCHNGKPVQAISVFDVLIDFLQFVKSCSNGSDKPVLLGHNAKRFDVPVLYHVLHQHHMVSEFVSHIAGFVDTLVLSKQLVQKSEVANYKQQTLVAKFLNKEYDAHNALQDVLSLCELHDKVFSGRYDPCKYLFALDQHTLRDSLKPMVASKCLSSAMASKVAFSGLGLTHLKLIHSRDPVNGIANLFRESVDGSVRVTKNASVVSKVLAYLNRV